VCVAFFSRPVQLAPRVRLAPATRQSEIASSGPAVSGLLARLREGSRMERKGYGVLRTSVLRTELTVVDCRRGPSWLPAALRCALRLCSPRRFGLCTLSLTLAAHPIKPGVLKTWTPSCATSYITQLQRRQRPRLRNTLSQPGGTPTLSPMQMLAAHQRCETRARTIQTIGGTAISHR
jgi:hypothetical protein